MSAMRTVVNVHSKGPIVRGLIIVARDQLDLWRALTQEFGQCHEIRVLLDRRQGERRQATRAYAPDRRSADRRNLPGIEDDVRSRQYVFVRPHYRVPKD